MTNTRTSPAISSAGPATNTLVTAEGTAGGYWCATWRDRIDWDSPADVYFAGFWDGQEAERKREELAADDVHRNTVRDIRRILDRAIAREKPVQPTGYLGGPVPMWDGPSREYLDGLKDRAEKARAAAGDRPVWTEWRQVHRDVTAEVWRSVWSSLCDRTRTALDDLDPFRLVTR